MNKERTIVVYHAGCPDGFAAAWAVWRAVGDDAEYIPCQYGGALPTVDAATNVIIVDFSFKRPEMEKLIVNSRTLLCLDHHKTAEKELEGLKGCYFDMDRSGAAMAWDYFHGDALPRPWLIDYVQDRDLWRWELPDSRAVSAWVMAQPHEFEAWDKLCTAGLQPAIELGSAIRTHIAHYCEHMEKQARWGVLAGVKMPFVNAPMFNVSDLLHYICELESMAQGCQMAACAWWERGDGQVQHSLRSIGDIDVSEIAKKFGGGGHKNAAGFEADRCMVERG
jgi:oligoribonuclease NrnB/cAMP/cGMP phosphodiesterase (DHH superfamily)